MRTCGSRGFINHVTRYHVSVSRHLTPYSAVCGCAKRRCTIVSSTIVGLIVIPSIVIPNIVIPNIVNRSIVTASVASLVADPRRITAHRT